MMGGHCSSQQFLTQTMSFYWKFVDTLVYNVATIAGFIVGVSQFLIRAFNENDGPNKVRKFINQSLFFLNKVTSAAYEYTKQDVPETPVKAEVKVIQTRARSRKRRAA
jgi:hypothetical protein